MLYQHTNPLHKIANIPIPRTTHSTFLFYSQASSQLISRQQQRKRPNKFHGWQKSAGTQTALRNNNNDNNDRTPRNKILRAKKSESRLFLSLLARTHFLLWFGASFGLSTTILSLSLSREYVCVVDREICESECNTHACTKGAKSWACFF